MAMVGDHNTTAIQERLSPAAMRLRSMIRPETHAHAGPMSGENDGWIQQMRTIAEFSCLRLSLIFSVSGERSSTDAIVTHLSGN